ncbi:MAG: TetR/AcrR family transcriptional regulator [Emcibacter sp.]|nr:TetR/AcrR family transcriptional regulator [Emcibacter sp.]
MRPQLGKDKIRQAALLLFAKNGFHTTSISQIAEAANVSKGLTYNYFKSKEDLLLAIINKASEEMFSIAETMIPNKNYDKTLRLFLDRYFLSIETNKDYLTFQLSLLFQPDLKQIVQAPLQKRADYLLALTETMFRTAAVKNSTMTARRFISELDGVALNALSVFKDYPLDEMKEQLYLNYKDLPNE